jgi:hypothetical protein
MARQMISCHKGLAPISFPADWLKNFNMKKSFASVGGEGRIRFPNGRAWGVSVEHDGADVTPIVRELSQAEINSTDWGEFTRPWESYQTTKIFGCGKITRLN